MSKFDILEKVVQDDKVAVLYSPGFGAGWYTWNYEVPQCLTDPETVNWVLSGASIDNMPNFEEKFGHGFYAGGADNLTVKWIPFRQKFHINEYDGAEHITFVEDYDWVVFEDGE